MANTDLPIPKNQQENVHATLGQWSVPYPLVSVEKSQSSCFCYSQVIFDSPSLGQYFLLEGYIYKKFAT